MSRKLMGAASPVGGEGDGGIERALSAGRALTKQPAMLSS